MMFILNPTSIKRDIVYVDDELKIYLTRHGHSPISRNDSQWIFIKSLEIDKLIDEYNLKSGR